MVATTATNIDKTALTAHEMAEAQRDSFEAIAENFAAAQRRSLRLAEGGLEFMRLQERNARAAQQGLEVTEQVARQGLRATEQATRQGLRVAEEATERSEDVLRQTEKVTREAELRAAVLGALKTANYDELSVEEVSKRIEGLPTEQLRKVREYEKKNKNRETLIEQIDRKIRANNNS